MNRISTTIIPLITNTINRNSSNNSFASFLSFIIISLLFSHTIAAQKINVVADRSRIFIGEQIKMKLSVEQGRMGMAWFQFPDTINHLEILSRSKIDTMSKGGFVNFNQTIVITSFDSGHWQFPALAIAGINQITMPVAIDVVPVDVSQKKDYNEIKDIEEVQLVNNSTIILIIAALTLFSLCMIIILVLKKRNGVMVSPALTSNETPMQWAISQLDKLKQPNENSLADAKNYYSDLNEITRTFFTLQLHENNRQLTTDEWMINLHKLEIDNSYKISFFQTLRMADSVRFAKYLPPAYENTASVETVKTIIQKAALLHSPVHSSYQPVKKS